MSSYLSKVLNNSWNEEQADNYNKITQFCVTTFPFFFHKILECGRK